MTNWSFSVVGLLEYNSVEFFCLVFFYCRTTEVPAPMTLAAMSSEVYRKIGQPFSSGKSR